MLSYSLIKPKRFLVISITIILMAVLMFPARAFAADGTSYTKCTNKSLYKEIFIYKRINNVNKKFGQLRVYKCDKHYFASISNSIGYAKDTWVTLDRFRSSNWWAYRATPEVRNKSWSVTKLVYIPSGGQCFEAFGSISTTEFGVANATKGWAINGAVC